MDRRTLAAVSLITGAGLLLRLLVFSESLFGDELSTLYLVDGKSLGQVFAGVGSDAEISPPLYFVLAWIATQLGDAPELVRLPALLCGTALVPLTFALGAMVAGRATGLFAAAMVALAPFMVFFSATGRAYTLMLLLLVASSICLLRATERQGWWWVAYALSAAAAMYSHYTAAFVLAAQVAWALWAFPSARRPLLLASAAAAALYLPWLGELRQDLRSPTNDLLQNLQGAGLGAKRVAITQWAVGHPIVTPDRLPGEPVWLAMLLAALAATAFAIGRRLDRLRSYPLWTRENPGLMLVGFAALATPLAEALLALVGNDLFGARNLTASWPFAAIVVGFLVVRSGRVVAICAGLVILTGLGYGAVRAITVYELPDYRAVAKQIEAEAKPGDSVVDLIGAPLTPVPLTPLRAELDPPAGVRVYDLNLPLGEPPFLPLTPKADPDQQLREAFRRSKGGTVFVVGAAEVTTGERSRFLDGNVQLPAGWSVTGSSIHPGLAELHLFETRGG